MPAEVWLLVIATIITLVVVFDLVRSSNSPWYWILIPAGLSIVVLVVNLSVDWPDWVAWAAFALAIVTAATYLFEWRIFTAIWVSIAAIVLVLFALAVFNSLDNDDEFIALPEGISEEEMKDYIDQQIDQKLEDAGVNDMSDLLVAWQRGDIVTQTMLTETLEDYVTHTELNTILADYATKDDLTALETRLTNQMQDLEAQIWDDDGLVTAGFAQQVADALVIHAADKIGFAYGERPLYNPATRKFESGGSEFGKPLCNNVSTGGKTGASLAPYLEANTPQSVIDECTEQRDAVFMADTYIMADELIATGQGRGMGQVALGDALAADDAARVEAFNSLQEMQVYTQITCLHGAKTTQWFAADGKTIKTGEVNRSCERDIVLETGYDTDGDGDVDVVTYRRIHCGMQRLVPLAPPPEKPPASTTTTTVPDTTTTTVPETTTTTEPPGKEGEFILDRICDLHTGDTIVNVEWFAGEVVDWDPDRITPPDGRVRIKYGSEPGYVDVTATFVSGNTITHRAHALPDCQPPPEEGDFDLKRICDDYTGDTIVRVNRVNGDFVSWDPTQITPPDGRVRIPYGSDQVLVVTGTLSDGGTVTHKARALPDCHPPEKPEKPDFEPGVYCDESTWEWVLTIDITKGEFERFEPPAGTRYPGSEGVNERVRGFYEGSNRPIVRDVHARGDCKPPEVERDFQISVKCDLDVNPAQWVVRVSGVEGEFTSFEASMHGITKSVAPGSPARFDGPDPGTATVTGFYDGGQLERSQTKVDNCGKDADDSPIDGGPGEDDGDDRDNPVAPPPPDCPPRHEAVWEDDEANPYGGTWRCLDIDDPDNGGDGTEPDDEDNGEDNGGTPGSGDPDPDDEDQSDLPPGGDDGTSEPDPDGDDNPTDPDEPREGDPCQIDPSLPSC